MTSRLDQLSFDGFPHNIIDREKFNKAILLLKESIHPNVRQAFFCSDNLIVWNRNLSLLRDEKMLDIFYDKSTTPIEQAIIWRTYILHYFAGLAMSVDGDFVELGVYRGTTAFNLIKHLDMMNNSKTFWLYDLFTWSDGDKHQKLAEHSADLYDFVSHRFEGMDFVKIMKGFVPESFADGVPESIAFAHIDMNNADPEVAALEMICPRLSRGGVIIFDDYGWWGYSEQKKALDPIIEKHGLSIVEFPTGQGLIVKAYN